MKRISLVFAIVLAGIVFAGSNASAVDGTLGSKTVKAGSAVSIQGTMIRARIFLSLSVQIRCFQQRILLVLKKENVC